MEYYSEKAAAYMNELCVEISRRAVGTDGNREATRYFSEIMKTFGFKITSLEFDCMDWICRDTKVSVNGKDFPVLACPYSLSVNISSELCLVTTAEDLKRGDYSGKILLLKGDIVKEQLIPKSFTFYNPEEHQELHRLFEKSKAGAIIAATSRDPGLAGGMYPFPFTEDGEFDIPSLFMKDTDGDELIKYVNKDISVKIDSERIPEKGYNVIANCGNRKGRKIIVCAHIDSKLGTPGAIDNASGVTVLMLLAELLNGYNGNYDIEITALNGEDYFSTPGQIKYLKKLEDEKADIEMVINLDGAGYINEKSAVSTYNCGDEKDKTIYNSFLSFKGIEKGDEWVQSDHSMFAQQGISCIAITSANMIEKLCYDITHTKNDVQDIVDCNKLVEIAEAISKYIRSL